jgi:hypothetical protein
MTQEPQPIGDNAGDISRFAFLCGADMEPTAIRRRAGFDTARFVSIGSTTAAGPVMPTALANDEVWGVVLRVPEGVALHDVPHIPVRLREGTTILAAMLTTADSAGTTADILAQARYWELPVPYRNRLEAPG